LRRRSCPSQDASAQVRRDSRPILLRELHPTSDYGSRSRRSDMDAAALDIAAHPLHWAGGVPLVFLF